MNMLLWIILFFNTLAWSAFAEDDMPSIRPGFYKVYYSNGQDERFVHSIPLGSLVYVYNKSIMSPTAPHIRRGLFVTAINMGQIKTRINDNGQSELFWKFYHSFDDGEGPVEILNHSNGPRSEITMRITQSISGMNQVYKLKYYKKRLDNHPNLSIIAHRGAAYLPNTFDHNGIYPANTLESFKEALMWGYDGIELDVRLTHDDVLMVAHDNHLRRVSNCRGRISRLLYNDIKDCLIMGSSLIPEKLSHNARAHVKINTLKTIIDELLGNNRMKQFIIDVKPNNVQRLKNALYENLKDLPQNLQTKVTILTASLRLIEELKPLLPKINFAIEDDTVGINVRRINNYIRNNTNTRLFNAISINIGVNFGIVQLVPERGWERIIRMANSHHIKVIGWTVNTRARLERMFRLVPQLDLLLTDSPISDFALAQFNLVRDQFGESMTEIRNRESRLMGRGGIRINQNIYYDSNRPW